MTSARLDGMGGKSEITERKRVKDGGNVCEMGREAAVTEEDFEVQGKWRRVLFTMRGREEKI